MMGGVEIQSSGAVLRAESWGSGPAVIALHAGVADRRMWATTLVSLAAKHQAIAYDRRGFGETQTPDEPFSHIDDLKRVMDFFGCKRPVLIGCSQGGRIAIDYALARPGKVAGLVLVASAVSGAPQPSTWPPEIAGIMEELEAAEARGDLEWVNEIEARLWLDGPLGAGNRVVGDVRQLFLDMNGKALRHPPLTLERPCPSAIEQIQKIAIPVLVVWGDKDFPHIQKRSAWLASTIPGAKSLMMPGCAHLPNLEEPERFNGPVGEFLQQFSSDGG